ncbi:hypothetical protein LCGC14_0140850 [marine sediment metagenome]|uniref:Uncharacterized protein n=1 Tax=marine sediment metagenome TaxID=412755 RepID=A0A0F9V4E7_9ZZZZ
MKSKMTNRVKCASCKQSFDKPQKRINETIKLGQQHACSRKCSSALTNENRRCEPTTTNAINTRKDKEKFPEKDHARSLVRRAIKSGKLTPLEECEVCCSEDRIEGHHPNHTQPFLLLYLCKDCHRRADTDPDKWEGLATDYSGCIR